MIQSYFAALGTLLLGDLVWIGLIAGPQYRRHLGPLMVEQPRKFAAGLFYLSYPAGIAYFAVLPGLAASSLTATLLDGAALGALAYATFSFTNWAVLRAWTWSLVVADIAWGAVITALSAAAGHWLAT